ncbi:MAG: SDR family NAD(P)-dependent oxidoreductase [Bacteroidales bacterium]|nr:SDR family NAD(P)-dependent oxidoreductase [Bacteroidales bacterium]
MQALVTGATSGMGLEYCRQLAQRGHHIVMVSNQRELLDSLPQQLSQQYSIHAIGRYQDLAAPDAAQQLFDWCQQQGLQIDILINNAGMFFFHELTPDLSDRSETMLALHMLTPTRLCALFGEEMKRRRQGYILNVSSLAAQFSAPGITLYAATKAYLKSYSQSLYFEMRHYGVGVTTVMPGAIATPLYRISPRRMALALKIKLVRTPEWLVRRALRGMFRHRRTVKPGSMNYLAPLVIHLLPNHVVALIWQKVNKTSTP